MSQFFHYPFFGVNRAGAFANVTRRVTTKRDASSSYFKKSKNKTETPGQRNPFHGFLTETHELIRKPSENQKKQ